MYIYIYIYIHIYTYIYIYIHTCEKAAKLFENSTAYDHLEEPAYSNLKLLLEQ